MKIRTVIIRPPRDGDEIVDLIRAGTAMTAIKATTVTRIECAFGPPASGWIRLDMSAGGASADWDLSYSPDPLSAR